MADKALIGRKWTHRSQEYKVWDYLQNHNGITSREAYINLGITQLGTRIYNLRQKGFVIKKEREYSQNRYGQQTHYDRYFIIDGGSELWD